MSRLIRWVAAVACLVVLGFGAATAHAQATAPAPDPTALAKATQNPVADLVSLPFQFNFTSGGGLSDQTFFNLNFQPVMPITLTPDWKLIARTIVPIVSLPGPSGTRFSGFGDIQEQLFLTPARASGIIWGMGPVFSFPTATTSAVSTGSWSVGPAAVVLKMTGPWVVGALVTQYWPFSDKNGSPKANQFALQYFVNYNFGKGWAISMAPTITSNWDAPEGQEWTVPFGIGISKTLVFNGRPMQLALQYYDNVVRPDAAGQNTLRMNISFLFPAK